MVPPADPTFEHALAELLQQTESLHGDEALADQALEDLAARYPEHAAALRQFWTMHRHFVAIGQPTTGSKSTWPSSIDRPERDTQITDAANESSLVGRQLGPYLLMEVINRGGMGIVYKARHQQLERIVALKVIRSGELAGPEELRRFRSETETASRLTHPAIVPIYEVGQAAGLVYFTMAYIDGQNLLERTRDSRLPVDDAVRLVHRLCQAVDYAHQNGVLHRDLKPGNVLITHDQQPIIIDFGLAKFAQAESDLTTTGQILGTPAYMAPEQASGKGHKADTLADVYSLGAILHYLLSGQPPFVGPTAFDILLQVMDRQPPAPSKLNRKVPRVLDYICSRAMEKKPSQRYGSAAEMGADLERYLKHEPVDLPHYSIGHRLATWWRRSPILVCHVCGIGTATTIAMLGHKFDLSHSNFRLQMMLLVAWLAACMVLQTLVFRARLRDAACLAWATVDVILFTWLVYNAEAPRTLLLIGYPMMIAASALFYRTRFVVYMTSICVLGFLFLKLIASDPSLDRLDFSAIFVSGLMVIGLTVHAMIRRIRGLSIFYEGV